MESKSDEKIRLLLCHSCLSTEVLPDFEGNPDYDQELEYTLGKHRFPNGDPHIGKLFRDISAKAWANPVVRNDVVKRLWESQGRDGGATGMPSWAYDTRETLKEDAVNCWRSKLQPSRCGEYHSDAKKLTPPTQGDRRAEGMGKYRVKNPALVRYLCDYSCPAAIAAETERRAAEGQYK